MREDAGFDRRRFLKQATTVAWATPLILTIGADRVGAQVMSCFHDGHCGTYDEDLGECILETSFACCFSCTPQSPVTGSPCFCE